MNCNCENEECNHQFFDNRQGDLEQIDKDQYSTNYCETLTVKCPECGNVFDAEDVYWENDETGDITR